MSELRGLVFIGAGQMAEAIVRGVLDAGLVTPDRVTMTDVRPQRLEQLRALGVRGETENRAALGQGDVVVLAVKPQDVTTVLADIGPHVTTDQLVVSIAAGVPIATLESGLERAVPVVRVMPNTPCLVRAGMAAVARGTHASPEHEATVLRIFNATGKAVALPEKQLDAVTALSGSGPGFIAVLIEALIDGGVRVGLARDVATTLAVQTTLGTAQLIAETGEHPARVKDMVTSPGGTTIAGIHALERAGVRAALIDAIVEATERSRELGS
ncbi:MAG: pyrroline-5-carboxylate reductase [Chloroflexota bacterium]|nr:pyrroline-5-carboxylate reductase [Chloroflexota bacterium]